MSRTGLKVTILGCGSSGGVPRIGGDWGTCDPENAKNRRRRCSILVQRTGPDGTTNLLVDTTPDMRSQLLDTDIGWLDGVMYTHEHADHIHGIDDLRVIAINGRARVDVYADQATLEVLKRRFSYCFESQAGSAYPPILRAHTLAPGKTVEISGKGGAISTTPFEQQHGSIASLGYRFGDLAYSSDINDLPAQSLSHLKDLDVWIVDALRPTPHPTHWSLDDTLAWIDRIKPARAILTNMHNDMDYDTLTGMLPAGIEPAYDGMTVEF